MIVTCPECSTQYRYGPAGGKRVAARLRCKKCGSGFLVEGEERGRAELPKKGSVAEPGRPTVLRRTALLADEPREFRTLLAEELDQAGFEVCVTECGEKALLLAGSHRFDLILLNVYLRRVLGVTICERIKATPSLNRIPVVLIGAFLRDKEEGRKQAQLYGANDFFETSLGREEMATRIRALAENGRAAEPSAPPSTGPGPSGEREEIRRLARIMISDIRIYNPEKFKRAVRDGTFFETFASELGRGKEIVHERFGHLPDRIQLLFGAFREFLSDIREIPPSSDSVAG